MDVLNSATIRRIQVINSHASGESTGVVIDGGPDLGEGPLADRRELFRNEHDLFRSAVVNESRGSAAEKHTGFRIL